MDIFKLLRSRSRKENQATVVTFTGGMGAQVISAAIYFSMRSAGQAVFADLTYFERPEKVAEAGQAGQCSHWAWQLGLFGLTPDMFATNPALSLCNAHYLVDGSAKLERGLQALTQPEVREWFKVPDSLEDILPGWSTEKYLCIHVRRGDYVNVASHLVSDEDFIALADKFSGVLDRVLVLSDSQLGDAFHEAMTARFSYIKFLNQTDADHAHRIMRHARALVCSNSQFSLIAAALNPQALALIPKQWFDGGDRAIEAPLHARCAFQVLSS